MAEQFASRNRRPKLAILPLGTGNDLARSLGLGGGHVGSLDVIEFLENTISISDPVMLDRWKISIGGTESSPSQETTSKSAPKSTRPSSRLAALRAWRPHLPAMIKSSAHNAFMYNYFSIGADALVTLSFAQRRDSSPWMCNSRLVNKLWYGVYGLVDMFQRECHDLYKHLRLTLDGNVLEELPQIEALVILNISCWGGGCEMLKLGTEEEQNAPGLTGSPFKSQQMDDGFIEVLGVRSCAHMAQMMAGFGSPVRIGQAKTVVIELLKKFPAQCDGEAWRQPPSKIFISRQDQICVLAKSHVDE